MHLLGRYIACIINNHVFNYNKFIDCATSTCYSLMEILIITIPYFNYQVSFDYILISIFMNYLVQDRIQLDGWHCLSE